MAALDGILKDVPNISYQYKMQQGELQTILGIESAPVVVEIRGEELSTLRSLTLQAQEELKTQPELYNVETSFDQDREEINIHLDRIRAGLLNVNIDAVASELEHHLAGRKASEWEHQGETQDILLKLPNVSVQELAGIEVPIAQQMVRIDDIADIQIERVPKEIKRENQMRVGFVTAQLMPDVPLDQVIREINLKLGKLVFPTDYRYQISGEEEKRRESFAHLTFALLLSIILVYMVMASQFESLVHPFTILLTIPLALTGSIFIFIILGKSLNIMAYIGLVMLGGIAVNNSILLVDAINQLKREGWKLADAVVEAGSRRIRPILMTSLTTILGLLPLTVGFGEGAALRQPMALAVIGGLITSTLLTLVVIPCVYIKLDRFSR